MEKLFGKAHGRFIAGGVNDIDYHIAGRGLHGAPL